MAVAVVHLVAIAEGHALRGEECTQERRDLEDLVADLLEEARLEARKRLLDEAAGTPLPTVILPVDQAEELFSADAGPQAQRFLTLLASLVSHGDVLRAILAFYLGMPLDFLARLAVDPGSVSQLIVQPWGPTLVQLNRTGF